MQSVSAAERRIEPGQEKQFQLTMSDHNETTIEELEQQHENYRRKAKRKPNWQRAADSVAEELVKAKQERVAELRAELPNSDTTAIDRAAIAQLQDTTTKHEVTELRDELNRHENDIAELERR